MHNINYRLSKEGVSIGDIIKEISIHTDDDGFILLKCPLCGEFFKLIPSEFESDDVIQVWCPCCGLVSKNYLTDEVINLGMKMAENEAVNMIFNEMKKWERQFKSSGISFKSGRRPTSQEETPIRTGIEALEIQSYRCCKRRAKIKPLIRICGSYCPYCGGRYDGTD